MAKKNKVYVTCYIHGDEKVMLRSQAQSHHVVMRARGGENFSQVFLCPDCHTTLHRIIEAEESNQPGEVAALLEFYEDHHARKLLELAHMGHQHLPSEDSGDRVISLKLPSQAIEEIKKMIAGKRINNRQVGVSRYLRMIVLSHLARHGVEL